MAEPKKTTTAKSKPVKTAKKSAPKKAVVKKKTAPKKTVAKKTPAKKVVAKKPVTKPKTTKKTTTKKASVAPKVAESVPMVKSVLAAPVLSLSTVLSLFKKCLTVFKAIWWKAGLINLMAFVLTLALIAIVALGVIPFAGGSLSAVESELANITLGTPNLSFVWALAGLALLLVTLLFMVSFVTSIALLLTVKNFKNNTPNNPFKTFFFDAWAFFGKYVLMSVYATWYVLWPLLVLLLFPLLALGLIPMLGIQAPVELAIPIVLTLFFAGSLIFVYRLVCLVSVFVALIDHDGVVKETFDRSLLLVKGNWWQVFAAIVLIYVPLMGIQQLLSFDYGLSTGLVIPNTDIPLELTGESSIVGILFSFFVTSPISLAFVYLMTLHLSKTKNIKF